MSNQLYSNQTQRYFAQPSSLRRAEIVVNTNKIITDTSNIPIVWDALVSGDESAVAMNLPGTVIQVLSAGVYIIQVQGVFSIPNNAGPLSLKLRDASTGYVFASNTIYGGVSQATEPIARIFFMLESFSAVNLEVIVFHDLGTISVLGANSSSLNPTRITITRV